MSRARTLSDGQVDHLVAIYRAWHPFDPEDGRTLKDIAKQFNVSVSTVMRELRDRDEPMKERCRPKPVEAGRPAINDAQADRLLDMVADLANQLGESQERVRVLEEQALAAPLLTPGTEALIDALLRATERIRVLERRLPHVQQSKVDRE
jgi:hypothetical protein